MGSMIDPYDWLNIPPEKRPPTLYQLLGVAPGERDAAALEKAAAQQMEQARKYQLQYATEATELLNAIAQALTTLLDANARATYDRAVALVGSRGPAQIANKDEQPVIESMRSRRSLWIAAGLLGISMILCAAVAYVTPGRQTMPSAGPSATSVIPSVKDRDFPSDLTALPQEPTLASTSPRSAGNQVIPPPKVQSAEKLPAKLEKQSKVATLSPPPTDRRPLPPAGQPVSSPTSGKASKRSPKPAPGDLDLAEAKIKELYQADFLRQRPADKAALADKLLKAARDEFDQRLRFALLVSAMEVANQAGLVHTTWRAINLMAKDFDIDVLELRLFALSAASQSSGELAHSFVVENALNLLDDAVVLNDYATAAHLLAMADFSAGQVTKKKETALRAQVAAERDRVYRFEQQFGQFLNARERLNKAPEDYEAHRITGRYLCLVNCNWSEGLTSLKQGGDPTLGELAHNDLAVPEATQRQIEMGDGWYERAGAEEKLAKACLYARARYWYRKALAEARGTKQAGVENRLKRIEQWALGLSGGLRAVAFPDLVEEKASPPKTGQVVQAPAPRTIKQAPRKKRTTKSFQQDQDKGFSIPSANFGDFFRNQFDSSRTKR
jgi:hypothetical protein